jgi:predicted ATPase
VLTTPKPEKQQVLLGRLSVFAGSCTLEAAEAVCAGDGVEASEIPDLLKHLVDKSLLVGEQLGGEMRYRLRDTTRQDRTAAGGEAEFVGLRQRHRDWYVTLAEHSELAMLMTRVLLTRGGLYR